MFAAPCAGGLMNQECWRTPRPFSCGHPVPRTSHTQRSSFTPMQNRNGRVTGCPSWIKCSLTCLALRPATDGGACGASWITLVVRLTARVSNRSLTLHPPCYHSTLFHARWCALAHDSLVAKSEMVLTLHVNMVDITRKDWLHHPDRF